MATNADDAGPLIPLGDTGGPPIGQVAYKDHLINLFERILFQLSPAVNPELITYPVNAASPAGDKVQTLYPSPMPKGLQVWALKNNSAKPIFVWFQRTTVLPQNYLVFAPGEFRAYLTAPNGGIYMMRAVGDLTCNVTLELWY